MRRRPRRRSRARPRGLSPGRTPPAGTPRSSVPGVPFGRHDIPGHQPPDLLEVLRLHPVLEIALPARPPEQVLVGCADAVEDRPTLEGVGDDLRVVLPSVLRLDVVDLSPEPDVVIESGEHPHLWSVHIHFASSLPVRVAQARYRATRPTSGSSRPKNPFPTRANRSGSSVTRNSTSPGAPFRRTCVSESRMSTTRAASSAESIRTVPPPRYSPIGPFKTG